MNWLDDANVALRTSLDDLRSMSADDFPQEQPVRVDVETPVVTIPLLVVKRDHADKLTVLNNGAVDLKRSQGKPIFQRSSWWQEINSHQIYVCDPGTVGEKSLALNWFQSSPPEWPNQLVTIALRLISGHLGIRDASRRTYYGSSAGGFTALLQLCADKNAKCVINNAQFDWTRWYAHHVNPVLKKHFNGSLAADVRQRWPHRANALAYLSKNAKPLNIAYYVNMASSYDRDIQLPIFEKYLSEYPTLCGSIFIHRHFDEPRGHNPLGKEATLRILNEVVVENTFDDFKK